MAKEKPQFNGMDAMAYDVMAQFTNNQSQQQPIAQPTPQPKPKQNGKIDNTGAIKITCAKKDERILKLFASKKDATIKQIILDALALYYEQPQNKTIHDDALKDLTKYFK